MVKSNFNKKYYFGGVYDNYHTFDNYNAIAGDLIKQHRFESFLDIGCGCGNLVKELRKIMFKKYHKKNDIQGVDISRFAVKKSKAAYIKLADCAKPLPFKNNQFDAVHIYTTFSYLKTLTDVKKAMIEAYRVAKNLIIFEDVYSSPPATDDDYDPYRIRTLNKQQWSKLWHNVLKKAYHLPLTKSKRLIAYHREEIIIKIK